MTTFHDATGEAIVYTDDGVHLYGFNGVAAGYLDGDSIYHYDGRHLGWLEDGWIRDHRGACAYFRDDEESAGPRRPVRRAPPARSVRRAQPVKQGRAPVPPRAANVSEWTAHAGGAFFEP